MTIEPAVQYGERQRPDAPQISPLTEYQVADAPRTASAPA